MSASARQYVEHLAQQIATGVADLRRTAKCPQCGHDNLVVKVIAGAVHVLCETPVGYSGEDNDTLYCGYSYTSTPVNITLPPFNWGVAEPEPKKPVRQRGQRRSATAPKKTRRRVNPE